MTNLEKHESLDEIVSHSAVVLADQIQKAAAWAKSEMDLQVEVAGALKDFARRAQIKLEGHHNVTVATGRPDSVYGSVIVEYKDPNTLSPTKDAAPNQKLVEQLKKRFYDLRREEKRQWSSMFGAGTDGKYFIFLRFRDDKWTDQEPLEVNRYSTERFLWALYNLGQKGKPYQPEYLHGDFGSDSKIAQEGIGTLYDEILKTDNPRAQVFFNQWKILFGEVCGYDVENLSDKLKKLAEFYGVKGKPQPAQLLFALHTYFAVLIKLLAAEIVSFFNPWMPRQVEKLQNATTSPKLRRELEQLERGGIFHDMGITNFLEGDLFSWYLAIWSDPIQALVRRMISKLDEYNPGTFSEEPAKSRDLLKKLYQQLFPKSVRHDLGEYFTPDWLAEHVLNEVGYEGDSDKRLLDPACGSGTFLVMAINRIRRSYDLNREKFAYDEGELLKKILANVIGFDLNPLAVMAARTNYLVAIKDLIRHAGNVEIPVYLCDSIMTPSEYRDLFTGGPGKVAKVPCSAMKPPHLLVPKEIAQNPKEVAKYADVLEDCVKNGYASEEFLSRCRDEGLNITATDAHVRLYRELVQLEHDPNGSKNGIWARIIKNNFAPLFVGRVDYVAGNPPWINWNNLPSEYRADSKAVWKRFGLWPKYILGASADFSKLFFYTCLDCYLVQEGRLGFVITQSLFKTFGGDLFRRFRLPDSAPLSCERVDDMVSLQPFEEATNRTAVVTVRKNKPTVYPRPYVVWQCIEHQRISQDLSLNEVMEQTERLNHIAVPVRTGDDTSVWLTNEAGIVKALKKATGANQYESFMGIHTYGANGIYFLDKVGETHGLWIVRNDIKGIKGEVEQEEFSIEPEILWPLLRGRDVEAGSYSSKQFILFPYTNDGNLIPESSLKVRYPRTYAFLRKHRELLENRSEYKRRKCAGDWHQLFCIYSGTFSPCKVVWREQSSTLSPAVLISGHRKPLIPDHKLMFIPLWNKPEAFFLGGLLRTSILKLLVESCSIATQNSTRVMDNFALPRFDEGKGPHISISELSERWENAAREGDQRKLAAIGQQLDRASATLLGITGDELKLIQEAQADSKSSKRGGAQEDGDE